MQQGVRGAAAMNARGGSVKSGHRWNTGCWSRRIERVARDDISDFQ